MLRRSNFHVTIDIAKAQAEKARTDAKKKRKAAYKAQRSAEKARDKAISKTVLAEVVSKVCEPQNELFRLEVYWQFRLKLHTPEMRRFAVSPTCHWQYPNGSLKDIPRYIFEIFCPPIQLKEQDEKKEDKKIDEKAEKKRNDLLDSKSANRLAIINKKFYRMHHHFLPFYNITHEQEKSVNQFLNTVQAELKGKYFFQGQKWDWKEKTIITLGMISVPILAYCSSIIGPLGNSWKAISHVLSQITTECLGHPSCADLYIFNPFTVCYGRHGSNHSDDCDQGILSNCRPDCDRLNEAAGHWGGSLAGILSTGLILACFSYWLLYKGLSNCREDVKNRFNVDSLSQETKNTTIKMRQAFSKTKHFSSHTSATPIKAYIQEAQLLKLKSSIKKDNTEKKPSEENSQSSLQKFGQFKQELVHSLLGHEDSKESLHDETDLDDLPDNRTFWQKLCCRKSC